MSPAVHDDPSGPLPIPDNKVPFAISAQAVDLTSELQAAVKDRHLRPKHNKITLDHVLATRPLARIQGSAAPRFGRHSETSQRENEGVYPLPAALLHSAAMLTVWLHRS